jgi:hypothetical protein
MMSRKKLSLVLSTCVLAAIAVAIVIHIRDSSGVAAVRQENSVQSPAPDLVPAAAVPVRKESAAALENADIDWAKEYNDTSDYFSFVSKAARKAYEGDGRAALYISKALNLCMPTARQYALSVDPEADFNAHWASTNAKAPQWALDRARSDFKSCRGFIKGDAFAGLPDRPGGYTSSVYWVNQAAADNDPVAQSLQAGEAISKTFFEKSSDSNATSMESAQLAINKAVASKDPAALFQVGRLLADGHASSDPLQGFAVSIAACDLGYDCTVDNPAIGNGCVAQGTCPPGMNYSDVIKKAVGVDGYSQAYARAQQLEDAMARNDSDAVQQLIQLKH